MKRAAVFLHGNAPSKEIVERNISKKDYIICADGGADYAIKLGLIPNIVVGDLDSISDTVRKKLEKLSVACLTFAAEKDETDSELAILHAIETGYEDIMIFGAAGDRTDHVLSNIFMLAGLSSRARIRILENSQTTYFIRDSLKLSGKRGEFISLIPAVSDVRGIMTEGLKYTLKKETLYYGKTRGMSNEFTRADASIYVKEGILIVVHTTA